MKKRLISFLLMVVMLVSLCSVIPVSASADAQVTTVTVAKGDTVLKLCQNLGVDFYTYKGLIMKLNGFTSEDAFNKIGVGAKISLPVSNQAAANLAGAVGTTTAGTVTAAGAASSGLTVGSVSSLPTGDYVAYYLVGYTVQKGETLSSIYSSMGLSYKTYENQICKLNNLKGVNYIQAGKTILLPTTSPTVSGTGVTTVMAHVMKSNENAYNIVCNDYALNYSSVQTMLQALNNRTNMGVFRVGEILYIPVSGVVSANTTVTPGTGSVTGSTTGSVSTSGAYNLVAQTPTNGSFDLQVSGKSVKSATSGQIVKVVTTPDTGYAVDTVKVTKVGDSNTAVTVDNGSFTMPAYSVTVAVTFKQAKQSDITVDPSANGAVSVMVDNSTVSKAYAGSKVVVRTTPNAGFKLDHVRVTYNDYRDSIAVENNTFTMPNFGVTVTATFKIDPDYNAAAGNKIYTEVTDATITAKVGENTVDSAKAGDRVTLTVTPKDNYILESIKVYCDNFKKTVPLDNMGFTMPNEPVTVVAVVKPTEDAVFSLNVIENSEGTVKLLVDGKEATTAKAGQTVEIKATSTKAFYYFLSTVTKVGDSSVGLNLGEANTFVMPAYSVDVNVKFYHYHNVIVDSSSYGSYNVTSVLDGKSANRYGAGVVLQVNVWGVAKNMAQGSIVLVYSDGSRNTLTDTNQFVMPDCDVRVHVNFTKQTTLVAHSIGDDTGKYDKWGNTYSVLGRTLNDKGKYPLEIAVGRGNSVTVSPSANIGYAVKDIWYTVKGDTTKNIVNYSAISGGYKFVLPDSDKVDLYVTFKELERYPVTIDYGTSGVNVGSAEVYTSLANVTEAAPRALLWLRVRANDNFDFDWSKVVIRNADDNSDITKMVSFDPVERTFTMPSCPIIVDLSAAFVSNMHTILYHRVTSEADSNAAKGTIKVTIDGITYANFAGYYGLCTLMDGSSAKNVKAGSCVYVTHESEPGYFLKSLEVRYADDTSKSIQVNTANATTSYFTMPAANVVISPVYEDEYYSIVATESAHGSYTVGSIAKVGPNTDNLITNIKPDDGYQLDSITLSYINADGIQIEDAKVTPTADGGLYYADPGLLPQSAVTVKVNFVPMKQEGLSIKYHFDESAMSAVNTALNYYVDLLIEGEKLPITRGVNLGALDTVDAAAEVTTDDTVIIRRSTSNADSNFEIENIWITYDENENAPDPYTNGDYYFKMPNVEKGCVIHVKYKLKNEAKYDIAAEVIGGTASINGVNIDGSKTLSVGLGSSVELKNVVPASGYEYPAKLTIEVDGKLSELSASGTPTGKTEMELNEGGGYTFGSGLTELPSIVSAPDSAVKVKVEFTKKPPEDRQLTKAGADRGDVKIVFNGEDHTEDPITIPAGTEFMVVIKTPGKRFTQADISTTDGYLEGGSYTFTDTTTEVKFTMPNANSTLTVATEAIPTLVPIELDIDEALEVTAIDNAIKNADGNYSVDVNSDKYPVVHVSVKEGKEAYGYKISAEAQIGEKECGVTVGEGTWQFKVPAGAKSIKFTADYEPIKHQVNIKYTDGSAVETVSLTCDGVKSTKAVSGAYLVFTAPEGKKFDSFEGNYKVLDGDKEKAIDLGSKDKGWVKEGDFTAIWVQLDKEKPLFADSPVEITVKLGDLPTAETPATAS